MRPGPDPRATRWIALRIALLALAFAAGFAGIAARVVHLQILRRDALVDDMMDQVRRQLVLKPRRGVIADRAGVLLAGSADARSVFADPWVLQREDRSGAALKKLAAALGQDAGALRRKLQKASRFVWLARRVSPHEAAQVERFLREVKLRGVALVPETRRYYPKGELASQVIGIVGDDGNGLEGVELALDDVLAGAPAKVPSLRDGAGRTVLAGAPSAGHEREGARVELTLDQGLQLTAERAVARAVASARAAAGMAVALDPRTGEVLALAGWPSFNPNALRRGAEMRNRAVADAFEPGSTMKTFAIAGALDAGVLRPRDPIDCGNGTLAIGAHVIHDHEALGWAGPSRILSASSNVGAAKIAARLGKRGLHDALLAFGFGERTGVDLPGEARGQVPFPRADLALATQAFGQGMSATALQVTVAMGAIANGGLLVRPALVKRVVDGATGEVLDASEPTVVRRVVSEDVAATVSRWLVGVVEDAHGTGKRARLDGWRAAGKTGTAQKADLVSGGYSADKRFSSFVGFAPAEAPRIVIGVFVDEPKDEIFGGEIAAPAFREIAEYALKMLGVPPTAPPLAAVTAAPDAREEPPAPPQPAVDDEGPRRPPAGGGVAVPSLAGLPARAAIRALEALDLSPDLDGSGRVVGQVPAAGRVVARGTRVRMTLRPAG
ncbi:MAG TPA: penicillin-binding protein [Anaeromyxobacter sp.]|nr:penicillin-binding protein [Anaeromyxobacter sp.]